MDSQILSALVFPSLPHTGCIEPTLVELMFVSKTVCCSSSAAYSHRMQLVGMHCNHNSHTMYIVSTPTVLYCKFFRHHCSHNCPFKILYCKLLSSMEPYGIDSQMQKPNYNIEICDTLRRGFPNSNCTGFPIPAAHRVH